MINFRISDATSGPIAFFLKARTEAEASFFVLFQIKMTDRQLDWRNPYQISGLEITHHSIPDIQSFTIVKRSVFAVDYLLLGTVELCTNGSKSNGNLTAQDVSISPQGLF